MRVAVVGAGVAGLVNARVLRPLGVDVVVYEGRADIGGVWSDSRGYPGQRLQNDRRSYALSDLPMPEDVAENPTRAEVHAYLTEYVRRHGLADALRLSTTVDRAEFDPGRGEWDLDVTGPDGPRRDHADWLIVANGTLSTPNRPVLPGAEAFTIAGGRIVDAADVGEDHDFAGERLVLLGYGKSATDIAVVAAPDAASVTVLARSAPWKLPYRLGPLTFQHLVITRLGEHLMWAPYRSLGGRVVKRLDTAVRLGFQGALARWLRRSQRLDARGLVPTASIRALSHLVTPGFDAEVDRGRVRLLAGARIERLTGGAEGPRVHLQDGTALPADVLVAATGYRTDVAFLDERTRELLLDAHGRMPLIRHALPPHAPRLLFAGWMNSFRSPIAAELQAVWIAALLHGAVDAGRLRHAPAHPAPTGLSIVDQDEWLLDVGIPVPAAIARRELLHPMDPAAYAGVHDRLARRIERLRRTASPARTIRDRLHVPARLHRPAERTGEEVVTTDRGT